MLNTVDIRYKLQLSLPFTLYKLQPTSIAAISIDPKQRHYKDLSPVAEKHAANKLEIEK